MEKSVDAGRGRRAYRPMAEINVTPFVDIMLVLLIVFMVTAPLLTVGVSVDLPQTSAAPIRGQDEPLAVTVRADGAVYLQDTKIEIEELPERLRAITRNNAEARIFVRGDRTLAYGRVMEVMTRITTAGFTKVALVTEQPQPAARRR
ncbi:MAG: protein TolR [Alphaproteobacteria bacterium]|nr:protein TolR [Alphaproteobacteria bacterium]